MRRSRHSLMSFPIGETQAVALVEKIPRFSDHLPDLALAVQNMKEI